MPSEMNAGQWRAWAARHAATLPANRRGLLRAKKGYCFAGALCDYAANNPSYAGGWAREPGGRWLFIDQSGEGHETHMPTDLMRMMGITGEEAAAMVIAEEDIGLSHEQIAELFSAGKLIGDEPQPGLGIAIGNKQPAGSFDEPTERGMESRQSIRSERIHRSGNRAKIGALRPV